MAAVAVVACEREESQSGVFSDELVSLEVRIPAEDTKISGAGGDEEKAVSDYQIFVFNMDSGLLEAYMTSDSSAENITLQCTVGLKEIVVLANAPDLSTVVSYDDLKTKRSALSDNAEGALVMEGHSSKKLTATANTVTVNISRIVSKVVLSSVSVDFEQDKYDEMDFTITEVYLTNVAGDRGYLAESSDPAVWYNKNAKDPAAAVKALIYADVDDVNLKGVGAYTDAHHFYCCPNPYTSDDFSGTAWTVKPTRLVVEAMLGTELYYYPISLPVLAPNTQYNVSLTIVRPGVKSPEQDMRKNDAAVTIKVEDWKETDAITERI